MEQLEKVERLRERANVSYEEAKQALEQHDWDMLEAMLELERQGKVKKPSSSSFTTQYEEPETIEASKSRMEKNGGVGSTINRFLDWVGKMVKKGCENYFKVERHGEVILNIPVIVFLLLCVFLFWFIFWLLVIGLFCNCRYSFQGPASMKVDLNKAMDQVADAADDIKQSFNKK